MIDAYIWGNVSRISPEAPVPIVSKTMHEQRLGGAGNVALNIQSLGANPILCSVIGNDYQASHFNQLLADNQLSAEGIIEDLSRVTTVKTRIISQNHHLLRVDEEVTTPLNASAEQKLIDRIVKILDNKKIDAIIFEDYDKGVITPMLIQTIVEVSNFKGIPTLVDPKKRNFDAYRSITFFKPNLKEFKEGIHFDFDKTNQSVIDELAHKYLHDSENTIIMITMAELGVYIGSLKEHYFIPAQIRNIADVSGAGDTVISVAAVCLAAGLPIENIARISNMAGGMVCEKPGVVPIVKDQLYAECCEKLQ